MLCALLADTTYLVSWKSTPESFAAPIAIPGALFFYKIAQLLAKKDKLAPISVKILLNALMLHKNLFWV